MKKNVKNLQMYNCILKNKRIVSTMKNQTHQFNSLDPSSVNIFLFFLLILKINLIEDFSLKMSPWKKSMNLNKKLNVYVCEGSELNDMPETTKSAFAPSSRPKLVNKEFF